jgi:type I restriction enzyme S subunit
MRLHLKPYPEFKDSGVAWLGSLPIHWSVFPNRALFEEVKQRDHPNEEMLSVTITRGVIRQGELLADSSKKDSSNEDRTAYKLVLPNDIVYNKMRAWQGAIGVSNYRGIVSPAYVVVRTRGDANPRYFHELYRTPQFAEEAGRWSYGITSDMWSLRPEHFRMIYSALPPRQEQDAIVRYLDHVARRIRRYIRAKKRLIAVLNEQKQAIIHRAVTEGFVEHLPLNVLGLPQQVASAGGWRSCSVGHLILKRWLLIQDGNHGELHPKASEFVDRGIPFLMAKDIRPAGLNLTTCAKITEERARRLRIGFAKPGDVLLTHKASIGQVGRVPEELGWPFVMLTPQVTYYRLLTKEITPTYLFLYMQSRIFQEQLQVLSLNQSTRPYIGLLEQHNLIICFPSIARQAEIVKGCWSDVMVVDGAINTVEREIGLLREYRDRLIADITTGKLDVREASATLPADLEAEASEDNDESIEGELVDELEGATEEVKL